VLVFCGSAERQLYLKRNNLLFYRSFTQLRIGSVLGPSKANTSQVVVAAASQYLAQVIKEVFNWEYR